MKAGKQTYRQTDKDKEREVIFLRLKLYLKTIKYKNEPK